jgi:hypothetical protein
MNKRHAKPTTAQLISRIYRKQIAIENQLVDIGIIALAAKDEIEDTRAEVRGALAMLSTRMESFRVLADHCARLLREKETLMAMSTALHPVEALDDTH